MATSARPIFRAAPRAGCDGTHVDVAIIGAGPVGLALAIDLAQRGVDVVLLDDDDTVSDGSRAICWSQRTLQIFDGLGMGDAVTTRGVRWNTGRVFFGDAQVHAFDLTPDPGHRRPAFVNLQQHHVEAMLVERAQAFASLRLRWKHRCAALVPAADRVAVQVDTPEGAYTFACDWLVACDGAQWRARVAGPAPAGTGIPRPVPDRGRADAVAIPGRAVVLVRPVVPPQPIRAAAPPGG